MLFIARRYLFSKRSRSVVNLIAWVSFFSVATPVAAIIILLSIFNGFGQLVEGMDEAITAELVVEPRQGRYFDTADIDTLRLGAVAGVEEYSFVCSQTLMVEHDGRQSVVEMRGVDENFADVVPIVQYLRFGDFHLQRQAHNCVVMGGALAVSLGVRSFRETEVMLYSLRTSRLAAFAPLGTLESRSVGVAGIFGLDLNSEQRYIYAPLPLARELLGRGEVASSLFVKVGDEYNAKSLRQQIESVVGQGFRVSTREEINPMLYDIVRYEKWGIAFISIMVMLLSSLSLVGIVAILITEKRADVQTLRTIGATRGDVRQIFFLQGMLLSGIGVACGMSVGVGVSLFQQHFGVLKLPVGAFVIDAYPVDLQLWDVVAVCSSAVCVAVVLNYIVTYRMIK